MRITRNRGLIFLAGLALVGGLAACAPTPDAADKTPELDSASQDQAFEDWQLDWETCMKDEGVDLSKFMAKAGETGGGEEETAPEPPSDADIAAMDDAREVCDEKLGDPPTRDDMPSDEEMNEMMLVFAKCMRDAGYDFPDPEPGPPGTAPGMPQGDYDPADMDACFVEADFAGAEG
ncbi:hypothetical protein [Microbacterium sp. SA39]|uniref:hypothetical protein n=1 Tax=Microbacterium sp. SA39 TaxID=1263625 RepID=UPI00061F51D4|nr:hypothetical protein [Microbacterium sp. SA39]KJQ54239.1 hypothetical protein RS85_01840 [Microbacterium sp. SA39]